MGEMHSKCYAAGGDALVTAIADCETERRKRAEKDLGCSSYSNIEDMLADTEVDLVDICTPTYLHEDHVKKAVAVGKNIMCEKPLALTVESCDAMIQKVDMAGVSLMVGHVIRFWPEYQIVKEIVDSGKHGPVLWTNARRFGPRPDWAWRNWLADPSLSGGALHDLHIHDQDYIAYLIGPPGKIQSRGVRGSQNGFDSVMSLTWDHRLGGTGYSEGSLLMPSEFPFTMALTVSCEKATIELNNRATPSLVVYPESSSPLVPHIVEPEVPAADGIEGNISSLGGYYNELKYYTQCIIRGKKPETVTPSSAREAVRICLAARESAETDKMIEL